MKIMVWGGSPKGKVSVTIEHMRMLENHLKEAEFTYAHPGLHIARLERDPNEWDDLMGKTEEADILILAMPVYYMLIPAGFKRFIELINERNGGSLLKDKTVGILITSIRYYDHTALNYLQAVCEDWECRFGGILSLGMHDVFSGDNRRAFLEWGENLIESHRKPVAHCRRFAPLSEVPDWQYEPDLTGHVPLKTDKKVILITDGEEQESRLDSMIKKAQSCLTGKIETYRLGRLIRGNCLGCLKCAADNRCCYEGKDGYIDAFREWMKADILIMAGTIRDRYLSSVWKSYFDRSFWRTHQPSFEGKQILWLISGPLSQEQNLQEILRVYGEMQGFRSAGILSDEAGDSVILDRLIEDHMDNAVKREARRENREITFRRVAGFRIFRDEVFSGLKIVFRRDHKTYRSTGIYDFPQRKPFRQFFVNLGYLITGIPFIQKKMSQDMTRNMIRNYAKFYN